MLMAIDGGLKTYAEVIAENGGDFEDVVQELSYEQDLLSEMGVVISTPQKPLKPPAETAKPIAKPEMDEMENDDKPEDESETETKKIVDDLL